MCIYYVLGIACADPESSVRGGLTLTTFLFVWFLVDGERQDPNTTISGPLLARQRNDI